MTYDSKQDTLNHKQEVMNSIVEIRHRLANRAIAHDESKLRDPEKAIFDKVTPKLRELTYGSDEYKQSLADMGPALQHHYEHNRHHPEHHENGVDGMNLVDIVEMFCDWVAATKRHADGNIHKSIDINEKRFDLSPQLAQIFRNTARDIFGEKEKPNASK